MNKINSSASSIINGKHRLLIRTYYEDTDSGGIIYYANYLKFAERARTEMLRETGYGHNETWKNDGISFVVRACSVEYYKPGKLDDILEVESEVIEIRPASLRLCQIVKREGDILVGMEIKLACIGLNGRVVPIPKKLRDQMLDLTRLKGHD